MLANAGDLGGSGHPHGGSWTDTELPAEYIVTLTPDEADLLASAAIDFVADHRHLPLDDPTLLIAAEATARQLPQRLLTDLIRFRIQGNRAGVLLVRNLPVDDPLPITPPTGMSSHHWSALGTATTIQLVHTSLLGHVIAYADEKMGRLIQDVCPVVAAEARQENTGSVLLELHSEDGFHPFKPDFLSLFCLRADHDRSARTLVGSIRTVLPELPPKCLEALQRPGFRIRLASSFIGQGPERYSRAMPVLSGSMDDPRMCVDFHAMVPIDDEDATALRILQELISASLFGVALMPGDLLIVDNQVAAHGRTSFKARYDGTDRWLRRCFAIADIRGSTVMRDARSRVLRPL